MAYYILIVFIPALLVVILSKLIFHHKITLKEMLIHAGGAVLGTLFCFGLLAMSGIMSTYDTEVRNGYVTSKAPVHVSCSHQYKCGETCTTDSKGNRSCVPIYCDEHAYDIDWDVHSTVGTFTIDRVDRRGLKEPARFSAVNIGEPASDSFSTRNYLLTDVSRFKTDSAIMERFKDKIPAYPRVYDYYRFNRVVNTTDQSFNYINVWLNDQLRKYGESKQLNVIVVVTYDDNNFYYAANEAWNGGKKNDVILYYGIDKDRNIKWFKANSFADGQDNQTLIQKLSYEAIDKQLGIALIKDQFNIIVSDFTRLPNDTFKYMDTLQSPSILAIMISTLFNILISVALAWYLIKEDLGEFNGFR